MKKHTRTIIQVVWAALTNGYITGFLNSKIYRGDLKKICVPGLNCYSCPGALGSCPIGSLQAVLSGNKRNFSFYVLGFLILFGFIFGRGVCGFLCPFGLLQDLLYKIKTPKLRIPKKVDKPMLMIKYVMLFGLVILLPIFLTNEFGTGSPTFCKWVCPAGTLEGGIPLVLLNDQFRQTIGFLFNWKVSILIIILISSVFIYRPFCKYLCPLGAFYGFFNKVSLFKMTVNEDKCTECGLCIRKCKMGVDVVKSINSYECIRCGDCLKSCPKGAIRYEFGLDKKLKGVNDEKKSLN